MTPGRAFRRRAQPLVWPLALLIVALLLLTAAPVLAAGSGLAFRLYALVEGAGVLVFLIGVVWLVVAILGIGWRLFRERR